MQVGNLVAKFETNASHWVNFWVHCASGNVFNIVQMVIFLKDLKSAETSVAPKFNKVMHKSVEKIQIYPKI